MPATTVLARNAAGAPAGGIAGSDLRSHRNALLSLRVSRYKSQHYKLLDATLLIRQSLVARQREEGVR